MINFAKDYVLPRLRLCALEMGVTQAWATAPRQVITKDDCVCAYSLIGATFQPTIRTKGQVKVARTYIQRFLIYPFSIGLDDIELGAESNVLALDWESKIHFYYESHFRLGTAELGDLRYCEGVVSITDGGLVSRPAPGGGLFSAIEVSLNIIMGAKADVFSAPYQEV